MTMNASKPNRNGFLGPLVALAAAAVLAAGCDAFAPPMMVDPAAVASAPARSRSSSVPSTGMSLGEDDDGRVLGAERGRRSVLSSLLGAAVAGAASALASPGEALAEAETMERGGVKLTPFNSLAFNYRGGNSPTIDASSLDEASIPYSEFLDKLNSDQVAFVEFLAPNGDAAYATLKKGGEGGGDGGTTTAPVRIGEGYPVEDPGGWSSPAFVIKAVAKKGVPYSFVVPGLGDSFKVM